MQNISNFSAVFAPKNKQLFGPILKKKLLIKTKVYKLWANSYKLCTGKESTMMMVYSFSHWILQSCVFENQTRRVDISFSNLYTTSRTYVIILNRSHESLKSNFCADYIQYLPLGAHVAPKWRHFAMFLIFRSISLLMYR